MEHGRWVLGVCWPRELQYAQLGQPQERQEYLNRVPAMCAWRGSSRSPFNHVVRKHRTLFSLLLVPGLSFLPKVALSVRPFLYTMSAQKYEMDKPTEPKTAYPSEELVGEAGPGQGAPEVQYSQQLQKKFGLTSMIGFSCMREDCILTGWRLRLTDFLPQAPLWSRGRPFFSFVNTN